ncbi:MAG: glycerophosphodiester phosphodiesterase family protein [Elainellaceae cyanobacterium]
MVTCPAWISQQPIAHRGLHSPGVPENSLAAFEAAIAQGYAIELDIQRLADGQLAVFHDKDLMRLTGQAGSIFEQTAGRVKHLKLLGSEQTVPLLQEALALIAGRVPVLIEIKNEGNAGPLERSLAQIMGGYSGDCAIQAFNPHVLAWFKGNRPGVIRGQLSSDFEGEDLEWHKKLRLSNLLMNWASDPQFIAYDLRALPSLPVALTAALFQTPVVAWTVRTEADWNKAKRQADNIIFEGVRP